MKPLTPAIGGEVHGVDLSKPLDEATLAALRATLLDRKVIFFRDQDITTDEHLAFARRFGELEVPEIGGDTLFADMYAAYEGLSGEVKERIGGQTAARLRELS